MCVDGYRSLLEPGDWKNLLESAASLKGARIVHVNSTKIGGGVAEILSAMIPLSRELGLDMRWETIEGNPHFFQCTKAFHNLLQGQSGEIDDGLLREYERQNASNAEKLAPILESADIVFIHDPQPLALLSHFPQRKAKWVWRCHIDLSSPSQPIWRYLRQFLTSYDATIFSLQEFAQELPHPIFIIPPSIDPFSEKNMGLSPVEIKNTLIHFQIDSHRPMVLQVSRFDQFKDPLGVLESYRIVKRSVPPLQLILAGGGATDDPEGAAIYEKVCRQAKDDPDVHILLLPPDAHRQINALQRAATIILQKSLKEGFGLTVTEALWKSKPVIGGNVGGIRLQILDHQTGFLVSSPQGAAEKIEFLLQHPNIREELGRNGKQRVKEHFLIPRHLNDDLQVMKNLLRIY